MLALRLVIAKRIVQDIFSNLRGFLNREIGEEVIKEVARRAEALELSESDVEEMKEKGDRGDHKVGRILDELSIECRFWTLKRIGF